MAGNLEHTKGVAVAPKTEVTKAVALESAAEAAAVASLEAAEIRLDATPPSWLAAEAAAAVAAETALEITALCWLAAVPTGARALVATTAVGMGASPRSARMASIAALRLPPSRTARFSSSVHSAVERPWVVHWAMKAASIVVLEVAETVAFEAGAAEAATRKVAKARRVWGSIVAGWVGRLWGVVKCVEWLRRAKSSKMWVKVKQQLLVV